MAFDKEEYWKNRKEGKRGQGGVPAPVTLPNTESKADVGFDEHGTMILKNRAWRRQTTKLPTNLQKKVTKRKKK